MESNPAREVVEFWYRTSFVSRAGLGVAGAGLLFFAASFAGLKAEGVVLYVMFVVQLFVVLLIFSTFPLWLKLSLTGSLSSSSSRSASLRLPRVIPLGILVSGAAIVVLLLFFPRGDHLEWEEISGLALRTFSAIWIFVSLLIVTARESLGSRIRSNHDRDSP